MRQCLVERFLTPFCRLVSGPYWIKFWLQLSKEEEKVFFENNCVLIEGRVLELFAIRGGISGIG